MLGQRVIILQGERPGEVVAIVPRLCYLNPFLARLFPNERLDPRVQNVSEWDRLLIRLDKPKVKIGSTWATCRPADVILERMCISA